MAFLSPLGAASGTTDSALYDLVFRVFLKLLPCTSSPGYGCANGVQYLGHDLIFNLLLPHALLIAFIFVFAAAGIIQNRGIQMLIGVAAYISIVYLGLYGFFASTLVFWFILLVVFAFINFITGGILHPARFRELYGRGFLRSLSRTDKRKLGNLKTQLNQINARIEQEERRHGGPRDRVMEALINQRHQVELEMRNLEAGR